METILPQLDVKAIEQAANEAATKGALKSIEEYYTNWNGPYRKAIDEILKKQEFGFRMELPDVVSLINERMTKEIDAIANEAVAKTFLPLVRRILVREDEEITFSDLLKEFVKMFDIKNEDDCRCQMNINKSYGWYDVELSVNTSEHERNYRMTLHNLNRDKSEASKKVYELISLPQDTDKYGVNKTMKLSLDGATLEMPFTPDVLKDPFMSYCARLIMSKTKISIDVDYFTDEILYSER